MTRPPPPLEGDPDGRVGVFTHGLWGHRREVAAMTGMVPVRRFRSARGLAAVAVWGRRPTHAGARAAAEAEGVPVWTLEDAFLRSVAPGPGEAPLGYALDPVGVHYDAARPSALEELVLDRALDPERAARDAAPALHGLRVLGLSKYNLFDPAGSALAALPRDPARVVLLADQTAGDASVAGAGAGPEAFTAMIVAAAEAHPGATLVLKTHPETAAGRRPGHFTAARVAEAAARSEAAAEARAAGRIVTLTARVRPRDLFARVSRVYAVSSLLGLEALAAGLPVTCLGRAFYAGWGLTEDLCGPIPRRRPAPLEALVAAAYADHCRWFDPETRAPIGLAEAVARLADRVAERRAA